MGLNGRRQTEKGYYVDEFVLSNSENEVMGFATLPEIKTLTLPFAQTFLNALTHAPLYKLLRNNFMFSDSD